MATHHHDDQYGAAPPRDQIRPPGPKLDTAEVPTSVAARPEGQDYVRYHSTDASYANWMRRARHELPSPVPGLGDEPDPRH
ncbi:hypothetical protein GCM10007860_23810 [Chitiniphilus shinanonensis]|uniref:Uncharacterized protein n=1 Tax=Chitiniphilus shinanonensis TaxID=553088 RepID=A0ABQ6BXK0_9NEIS|nr:hypothetical protein [Chitiniphilus shinanonensis]GLS05231.1 hypothetical protein GCM10007860_23810 [Chitiniphilus shinanonensis]